MLPGVWRNHVHLEGCRDDTLRPVLSASLHAPGCRVVGESTGVLSAPTAALESAVRLWVTSAIQRGRDASWRSGGLY